jgi:hypothetical protein
VAAVAGTEMMPPVCFSTRRLSGAFALKASSEGGRWSKS